MRSRASGGLEDYYTIFLSSHFAYRSCSLRNTVSMPLSSCFACGSHSPTGHIIPHPPAGFIRSFSNHLTNFVSTCYN